MNKPPDATPPVPARVALTEDERIEDYLEHLGAPLVGIVPYPERKSLLQEARAHIDGLTDEYVWQGKDRGAASRAALHAFGEPWNVGQAFLQEWLLGSVQRHPKLLIRKATAVAFACFGLISLILSVLLEHGVFVGSPSDSLAAVVLLSVAGPIIAGILTGLLTPMQSETGVRNAVLILALHTFALGLLLLPRYEAIALSAWQIVFWLPAGRVCAAVAANHFRQLRRRRFWRIAHS